MLLLLLCYCYCMAPVTQNEISHITSHITVPELECTYTGITEEDFYHVKRVAIERESRHNWRKKIVHSAG